MGSEIRLHLGDFLIDWAKNGPGQVHGVLFQADDNGVKPYEYVDENGSPLFEISEAAIRPLARVVPRLELLGFGLSQSAALIADARAAHHALLFDFEEGASKGSFNDSETQLDSVSSAISDPGAFAHSFAQDFLRAARSDAIFGTSHFLDSIYEELDAAGPYAVLRLLAEDPQLSRENVTWEYADVVAGGWIDRDWVLASLGRVRSFLIVTEGSSDSKIIRHAMETLRPDVCEFFEFVDMDKGYPFSGSSNLHRFCQGLVSIGIENNVVILYDNDTEGNRQFERTAQLDLPRNIRVVKLPELSALASFDTIGPDGSSQADINGTAAAIECFLDLRSSLACPAQVRWTTYNEDREAWQGALIGKTEHVKRFLNTGPHDPSYDYSKLESVINVIVAAASEIAEATPIAERRYAPL